MENHINHNDQYVHPSDSSVDTENPPSNTPLIPAYRDTFVHYLFGVPKNEDILLDFVNAVLDNDDQPLAKSVEAQNPFNPATFVADKYSILDVKAKDDRGDIFVIEFQTAERQEFADRMVYYGGRTFAGQMLPGEPYTKLKTVVGIAVTAYTMFPQLKSIHNSFFLTAKRDPNVVLTRRLQFHFLEASEQKMAKVSLVKPSLRAWMFFFYFAHTKTEAEMVSLLQGFPVVLWAYREYRRFNLDRRMLALDEAHQRFLHDFATGVEAAKKEGLELGKAEGLELGRAEGLELGREEGMEKGRLETLRTMVQRMVQEKYSLEMISCLTNLSVDGIQQLR